MATNYLGDNWQRNKGVCERNKHMLEQGLDTDVVFQVSSPFELSEAQIIRAHKYMLISASPVFWAMLCGDLQVDGDIVVPDVAPDAFREMLRFIYTEQATFTGNNVMQILHAAKKYQLCDLVQKCVNFLDNELDASNACSILDHSQFFDEKQLMTKCLETIEENTTEALNSEDFLNISTEALGVILDSNKLSTDEVEIFDRSYEWSRIKNDGTKSIRDVLGKNLFKIRFPVMPTQGFNETVCSKDILTETEQLQLLRYMVSPETSPKPAGFCCEARQPSQSVLKPTETMRPDGEISVNDQALVLTTGFYKDGHTHRNVYVRAPEQGTVLYSIGTVVWLQLDRGVTIAIDKGNVQKL